MHVSYILWDFGNKIVIYCSIIKDISEKKTLRPNKNYRRCFQPPSYVFVKYLIFSFRMLYNLKKMDKGIGAQNWQSTWKVW